MNIRCKFKVDSIERTQGYGTKNEKGEYPLTELRTVKMSPVYGNGDPNHENTRFWGATPSGQIVFSTVNAAAADSLELGAEYYVDIIKA